MPFWNPISYHFFMKTILFIFTLVALLSCGQKGSTKLYKVDKTALTKFVNEKNMPSKPNLSVDKSIVNNVYPIEIALYEDGRFYYDLPNLGDGNGKWKLNSDGVIELKAKRSLFDMYIEVHGTDEAVNTLTIHFSDRFGPNVLKMENNNI